MVQGQLQGVVADVGEVLDRNQRLDEALRDACRRLHEAAGQVRQTASLVACPPAWLPGLP